MRSTSKFSHSKGVSAVSTETGGQCLLSDREDVEHGPIKDKA